MCISHSASRVNDDLKEPGLKEEDSWEVTRICSAICTGDPFKWDKNRELKQEITTFIFVLTCILKFKMLVIKYFLRFFRIRFLFSRFRRNVIMDHFRKTA